MRSVCVIGGAGFVGSNIAWALHESGIETVAVDNLSFGYKKNLPPCEFIHKDFCMLDADFFGRFDTIVVAYCSNIIYAINNQIETIKNNAISFYKFLQLYQGKVIYLSTASVYGNADIFPTPEMAEIKTSNAYDTSKRIAELFLQQRGNYTTLRLSNVFGRFQRNENPYCGAIGRMTDRAMNGRPIEIYGDGESARDYTNVQDVTSAVMLAINQPPKNTEINIATGSACSSNKLCTMIWRILDKPEKYKRLTARSIDGITYRCLDNSLAKKLLGWSPMIGLEEGINITIRWKNEGSAI